MFGKKVKKPTVAIVPLHGPITDGGNGIYLDRVAPQLDSAFQSRPDLLVLKINCPGGSPVQSQLISQFIVHRSNELGVPVAAFCEDVAASGGYWLAMTASPNVFVTPMSIIGSIGVVGAGFGFHKVMEELGIERRLYTQGKNKVTNDPFSPETDEGREKVHRIQKSIYDIFVSSVKHFRAVPAGLVEMETGDEIAEDGTVNLLKADDETLFNGDVWVGQEAIDLGLADMLYVDMRTAIEEVFFDGNTANYRYYVEKAPWFRRVGIPLMRAALDDVHAKIMDLSMKSRFGL